MMVTKAHARQPREAVAVFENEYELLNVIEELESAGFDHSDISVLPSIKEVERQIGHQLTSIEDAEDDPDVPRTSPIDMASFGAAQGALIGIPLYIGAISAIVDYTRSGADTGAVVVAGLVGGVIGGAIGLVLASLVRRQHARRIKDQIDHGGLLLWVRTRGRKHEDRATSVITDHIVRHFHMHGEFAN